MGKGHKNKISGSQKAEQSPTKLFNLLESLLLKCSVETTSWNEEWETFKEIYGIIEEIRIIEKDTKTAFPDRLNNFDQFLIWCSENGALNENVTVKQTENKEFGVFAQENLKEGELFFTIPRKLMLSTQTARESKLKPVIEKDPILQKMPNVLLALHMLAEFVEETSFWKPYLNILPSKFSTILYFTLDDLEELKGSPTLTEALKICRSIARQYAYFNKLFMVNKDLKKLKLKNYFTYDLYRWAVSCVMTRQNAIPSETNPDLTLTSFVPLWDMCNHHNNKFSTDFNVEKDHLECYAMQNFDKGEEVFIFYGPRSNSELFLHSGFIMKNNPHDYYPLRLGISKSDSLYKQKEELCIKNSLPMKGCFNLMSPNAVKPGEYSITKDLLNFCQILTQNKDCLLEDCTTLPVEIKTFLTTRLSLLLKAYKTTIEDDEKLLLPQDSNLLETKRLAINMRLSEKYLLTSLLNVISKL